MQRAANKSLRIVIEIAFCIAGISVLASAGGSSWKLSDGAIGEARTCAQKESIRSLAQRRPSGLGSLDSDEAVQHATEMCIRELPDRDSKVSGDAMRKLQYIGRPACRSLLKGMESDDPTIRKWCILALQDVASTDVAALAKTVRSDTSAFVRTTAAKALGDTFAPTAVPALIDALKDRDFNVRFTAIRELGTLRDKRASAPLGNLVTSPVIDEQLRHLGAEALLCIDRDDGTSTVKHLLESEKDNMSRHNLNVLLQSDLSRPYWPPDLLELRRLTRDAAGLAGEQFGTEEIEHFLRYINSPNATVSSACLRALGQLRAESAIPGIIASTNRQSAYDALAQIASPRALDILLAALQSSDADIRLVAVRALGNDGGRWAVPLLIELLDDPSLRIAGRTEPAIDLFDGNWPEEHHADLALFRCLGRMGFKVTLLNLADGAKFDLDKQIIALKEWWKQYGQSFLQGKVVPDPGIKGCMLDT